MTTVGYTTTEELARLMKVSVSTYEDQLTEVLVTAQGEIDNEIGRPDDDQLTEDWELGLAAQVQLERAQEHWKQRQQSFGILSLDGEQPVHVAQDTWRRMKYKLAPLKRTWGLA